MATLRSPNHLRPSDLIGTLFGTWLTLATFLLPAFAQSADPNNPAPLKPGINSGEVDSFVGPLFYSFVVEPGPSKVRVTFSSMGLYGNPTRTTIGLDLYDEKRSWNVHKDLTSNGPVVETTFTGDVKEKTKVILRIQPPPEGLLRQGGKYTVEVTGLIETIPETSTNQQNPIVGTYKLRGGYRSSGNDVATRFNPNGTLQLSDGNTGTWELFDQENMIYVVTIGGESQTLKLIPGKGLVDVESGVITFLKFK